MDARRVFLIGSSLFAESIARTLANSKEATLVGSAPDVAAALPALKLKRPDAVIVTGLEETATAIFDPILAEFPDLPIIRANPNAGTVQVITSQHIRARRADLLAAITALPKRKGKQ